MSSEQYLLEMYSVSAHFYTLCGSDALGATWKKPCRSVLEIMAKEKQPKNPGEGAVDAIIVMMNPGSSKPRNEHEEIPCVSVDEISSMKEVWVDTYPDKTQFQIMRVMDDKKWKHVLVINLSDIRNANSNGRGKKGDERRESFSVEYTAIEVQRKGETHSIFCKDRRQELERHLARVGNGPIVLAWGVGSYLSPLIERAKIFLAGKYITGWRKETKSEEAWKYYHPFPRTLRRREDWRKKFLGD